MSTARPASIIRKLLLHFVPVLLVCAGGRVAAEPKLPATNVSFHTSAAELQRLYDAAEARAAGNIVQFIPAMQALVEGGGYPPVGLPTLGRRFPPVGFAREKKPARSNWSSTGLAAFCPTSRLPASSTSSPPPCSRRILKVRRSPLNRSMAKSPAPRRRDGGKIVWDVTVPWNSTATVKFPDGRSEGIAAGKHRFTIETDSKEKVQ